MFARLPKREDSASRILDYRHSTYCHHVKWWFHKRCAFRFRLFRAFIDVINRNVAEPMRWNSLRFHLSIQLVERADLFVTELEHCVNAVWAHRMVFVIPAEELRVEILCGRAVSCAELNPTERTGLVTGSLLHSRFSHLDRSSFTMDKTRGERFYFWKAGNLTEVTKKHKADSYKEVQKSFGSCASLSPKTKSAALSKLKAAQSVYL